MRTRSSTTRTRWPAGGRTLVALAAMVLIPAACGSDDPPTGAQPDSTTATSSTAISADNDVPYGATLEEWSESTSTQPEPTPTKEESTTAPEETPVESESDAQVVNDFPEGYEQLSWDDLRPPGASDDEVYARYEDQLAELDDGSPEANEIYAEMEAEREKTGGEINTEVDGTKVNLAGFVAPLTTDADVVTEFLLVPYFGACIHVPPPPPNQTILVTIDESTELSFEDSLGAVWVAGTLTVDPATTDLATASYTITNATSGVYDEHA